MAQTAQSPTAQVSPRHWPPRLLVPPQLVLQQLATALMAGETPDDETAARLRALIASTAERWARRISRAGSLEEKDVDLIAEALAVPTERVAAWAASYQDKELTESGLCQSLTQLGMNTGGMTP